MSCHRHRGRHAPYGVITALIAVTYASGCAIELPDPVIKTVGSSGGTIAVSGGAKLTIPPGALPENTSITIKPVESADLPEEVTAMGLPYKFEPSGLKFEKPISVTLPWSADKLPDGMKKEDLVVWWAPGNTTDFVSVGKLSITDTEITAEVTHFSTGIAGLKPSGGQTNTDPKADAGATNSGSGSEAGAPVDPGKDAGVPHQALDAKAPPPPPKDGGGTTASCPFGISGDSTGCTGKGSCNGHTYEVKCIGTTCTCYEDGKSTKTFTGDIKSCDPGKCGFPQMTPPPPPTDAGVKDGGGTTTCPPFTMTASTTSCEGKTTCNGHTYSVACSSTGCTCSVDGKSVKTYQGDAKSCDPAKCGFGGTQPPPPPPPTDGGVKDGGTATCPPFTMTGSTAHCEGKTTCNGHTYAVSCLNSGCTCYVDGQSVKTYAGDAKSCDPAKCGFGGTQPPPPPPPTDGGTAGSCPPYAMSGSSTSCSGKTACNGHTYEISCSTTNCSCILDGKSVQTYSGGATSCDAAKCTGFPVPPPPPPPTDGGATTNCAPFTVEGSASGCYATRTCDTVKFEIKCSTATSNNCTCYKSGALVKTYTGSLTACDPVYCGW